MAKKPVPVPEPDFQTATLWWSDLPNIWTPLGWKDHLCRFNVLWNGCILAQPYMNRRTAAWKGQGLQLAITPHYTEWHSDWAAAHLRHDDGMVKQGWEDDDAPVLWTEWAKDGLLLRAHMFAHVPGGVEVKSGDEPLFAWVRLSIHELCPALPLEDVHGFNLILQTPNVITTMSMRDNVRFGPADQSIYPRELKPETDAYSATRGLRILEPDGRVRLAVAPGNDCRKALFLTPTKEQPWTRMHVSLPCRKGAYADLLVPMCPCDRALFDRELKLGYDGARRETRRYWRRATASPTRFAVPEAAINDTLRQSLRFSNLLTEKNPATGKTCKVNGSWTYADLWTTPGAMDLVMLMDMFGQHRTVARCLDIFREEQGTVTPPGPAYERHPGYLSTPALYKSIDWLSDNGAVLYTLAMHALLSGDRKWAAGYADCLAKSCDWIKGCRAKTNHGGYPGVLPPAVATDAKTEIQAVWSVGWNYKGLCAAVRVLQWLGHPRAAEFAAEAKGYREAFLKAFRDKCTKMPTWTDAKGRKHCLAPTALAGDAKAESRHAFFLDTGALFLVFAGLLDAADPLMQDICAWFRNGPQRTFYRRDANCWQVAVLDHEMSSCEPCYSWNVFHSWQLGDRERFLEGMYSLFAGSVSRQTRISCETRGGITGNVFSAPLALYLARLAVIDDQLKPGELHLLRLMPLAWLKPGAVSRFESMPTEFGPVTLIVTVAKDGQALDITWKPTFRGAAPRVILHTPPLPGLQRLTLNGQPTAKRSQITVR